MNSGNLFETLRNYYASSGDRTSKLVDFLPDIPSQFLRGSEYVAEKGADFTIIDSFAGAMPIVLDHRFLIQGQEAVPFSVDILLDSNVVSYLHQYVTDRHGVFRKSDRGIATFKLIRKLAEYSGRGWEINPFFYLLEAVSKNNFHTAYQYAQALVHSIKTLQLMNEGVFLETGRIEGDAARYRGFSDIFASASLETVSASDVLYFSTSSIVTEARRLIDVIYAALLKITIIDRQPITAARKLSLFFQFLREEIGFTFPGRRS